MIHGNNATARSQDLAILFTRILIKCITYSPYFLWKHKGTLNSNQPTNQCKTVRTYAVPTRNVTKALVTMSVTTVLTLTSSKLLKLYLTWRYEIINLYNAKVRYNLNCVESALKLTIDGQPKWTLIVYVWCRWQTGREAPPPRDIAALRMKKGIQKIKLSFHSALSSSVIFGYSWSRTSGSAPMAKKRCPTVWCIIWELATTSLKHLSVSTGCGLQNRDCTKWLFWHTRLCMEAHHATSVRWSMLPTCLVYQHSALPDRTVCGFRFWNSLPDNVTSANSLSAFRQQLKHTLFQQSFPDIIMWHFLTVIPIVVQAVALLLRPP